MIKEISDKKTKRISAWLKKKW